MKILFVSSGNSITGISSLVKNQGEALKSCGLALDFFMIKSKGVFGYLKFIPRIHNHIRNNDYDIIHAHYSFSGIAAVLAKSKPLIVSLMGSDVRGRIWFKFLIQFFNAFFWDSCIVKSEDMKITSGLKSAFVIPNGVDLSLFKPLNKLECQLRLGWDTSINHILFAANPLRPEKNFQLAQKAFNLIEIENKELHFLKNVNYEDMPQYYNAADVIILTSKWEGSPNVIKEAMSCNKPIVTTNVGDVMQLFGNTIGNFIASEDPENIASNIEKALQLSHSTDGRQRILELGLDSLKTSEKIIHVYKSLINENHF